MRALLRPFAQPLVPIAFLLSVAAPIAAFGRDRGALRPAEGDPSDVAAGEGEPRGDVAPDDVDGAGDTDDGADDDVADDDVADDDVADDPGGAGEPSGAFGGASLDDAAPLAGADAGKPRRRRRGGCPSSMARVGQSCVDRYEAPNHRGARPLVMQSANDADAWCAAHHRRLCTEDEWIAACEGDDHRAYPYGNERVDGRCNDDKPRRPVDEHLLAKWPAPEAKAHVKSLYQATPSGSKRKCVSEAGVRDLTGNVEEWVVRTREHENDPPDILAGGYWSGCHGGNRPTCRSADSAHGPAYRSYETGFRCCRDAKK